MPMICLLFIARHDIKYDGDDQDAAPDDVLAAAADSHQVHAADK